MAPSRASRPTLLSVVIVVLFGALAVLQYRWVAELSGFQREQLSQSVVSSTDRFVSDLDDHLERLWLAFHVQGDSDPGNEIAQDYREWSASSRSAQWVRGAFWVSYRGDPGGTERSGEGGESGEHREGTGEHGERRAPEAGEHFEDGEGFQVAGIDLTSGRLGVVDRPEWFARLEPRLSAAAAARGGEGFREADSFSTRLDGNTLAFVVAQMQHDARSWAIVLLREDVIVGEVLPRLVGEHFGADGERDYDVCVFDATDADEVIFATAAAACPGAGAPPDLIKALPRFGGSAVPGAQPARSLSVAVAHTAGSLDSTITAFRNRNLMFGFGVMLVLGAAVAVLVVASRRSQQLAERQLEFVAGVSHELRTPIAGISSLSQNLAHGVVDGPERTAEYGERIYAESRRLTDAVDGVLNLSAIRSGNYRYAMEDVDVAAVVGDAIASFDEDVVQEISVDIADDTPAVRADSRALGTVMRNLLGNAIKFSAVEQSISVVAGAADGGVEIRVEDRGQGIDAADLDHIFEPFFRGSNAERDQVKGSGIGLNLVREIVEAHGGRVGVESTAGKGSSFQVWLPAMARPGETP